MYNSQVYSCVIITLTSFVLPGWDWLQCLSLENRKDKLAMRFTMDVYIYFTYIHLYFTTHLFCKHISYLYPFRLLDLTRTFSCVRWGWAGPSSSFSLSIVGCFLLRFLVCSRASSTRTFCFLSGGPCIPGEGKRAMRIKREKLKTNQNTQSAVSLQSYSQFICMLHII